MQMFAHDLLGQLEGNTGGQALGEGAIGSCDESMLLPRFIGRRGCFRLHADDLDSGIDTMGYNANSGSAAITTNWYDNDFKNWLVFQHLHCFYDYSYNQQVIIFLIDFTIHFLFRQFF